MNFSLILERGIRYGYLKRMLSSSWSYRLLNPFLRGGSTGVKFAFELTRDANLRRKPVAFTSLFFPSELVYALGMVPFPVEVISGVISSVGMAVPFLRKAEANWYSPDLCSFHRLAMGLALEGYLPSPDIILSSTCLCDGSSRLFANLAHFYKVPHILVEVPPPLPENEHFLKGELQTVRQKLEVQAGKKIQTSDWERVFFYSNSLLRKLREISRMQEMVPCFVPGDSALSMVGAIFVCAGSPWGPEIFSSWEKTFKEPEIEKYRLFWLHLGPYYQSEIFPFLREMGISLVGNELSSYLWEEMDPFHPEESLIRKFYGNFGIGPLRRRIEAVRELVHRRKADGVISFSHRGCRQSSGGAYLLREALKREGVPCLILDGDCVDPREMNWEQVRTRLEAFLEML